MQRHPVARSAVRLYDRYLGPHEIPRDARAAFRSLGRGTVAVDCGANVGRVTALLAERGADVYAFEPNPHAFEVLERRFAAEPRVRCLPQAVAAKDGAARLHLHVDAHHDPVKWSSGSSLFPAKPNVDPAAFVDVETVDLARFLDSLGREVRLLKLDVEGAEIEILERLLASGHLQAIEHVLVEMHDDRIPGLGERGAELRARLAAVPRTQIRLDWD